MGIYMGVLLLGATYMYTCIHVLQYMVSVASYPGFPHAFPPRIVESLGTRLWFLLILAVSYGW